MRRFLFLLWEWWRWVEMKVGFWIWEFHVFENEVQVIMDLIGVGISAGKDSHLSSLSEIAASLLA